MMDEVFLQSPHRRWNPLKREWVVVSPHRTQRPWQGQVEDTVKPTALAYDPHLLPLPRQRACRRPQNPCLHRHIRLRKRLRRPQAGHSIVNFRPQWKAPSSAHKQNVASARVVCFDPRHDLTLATMQLPAIRRVVDTWAQQAAELGANPDIQYVQIFENRGAMMGASNPHPHGQIWATEHIPNEPLLELAAQREYFAAHQAPLLSDYLALEQKQGERIIAENETWAALVPFWAVWPFETLLLPKQYAASVDTLSEAQREGLAAILQQVTAGYNRVFDTSFPYSMGLHSAPSDNAPHPEWLMHLHFYPPLLRSATVRKFMVGFELLGSPQRDITPESAAATLRAAVAKA